jgi:diguanylate cyclase (GGDEF)-like protein
VSETEPDSANDRARDARRPPADLAAESLISDQALAASDQSSADCDQTGSESDHSAAEKDQNAADGDQAAADADQAVSDREQAASDRDLAHGADHDLHDYARAVRERGAQQRKHDADARCASARGRDAVAAARDTAAFDRDRAAAIRDRKLAAHDAAWTQSAVGNDSFVDKVHARADREMAATSRAAARDGRARAAAHRAQAESNRERAAGGRTQERLDRDALVHQRAVAETDALTGTRSRASGLVNLEREIERARRTGGGMLAVAYVDVVGVRSVTDSRGHAAADSILQRAVHQIRAQLRCYDLMIRLDDDEFLCTMSGARIQDARQRFASVQAELAADEEGCEIKVGFAALAPEEDATQLIARADAEMPASAGP